MSDYKLTPEQEERFNEWNWRSDSSFGKIKSSTDIRELKILLAQEIQGAVEAERTQTLNEVRELVDGMRAMTITNPENNHPANAYKLIDRNDLLQAIEKLKENHD